MTAFQKDMLEALETGVQAALGFRVTDHEVKLYGICRDCLEKEKEQLICTISCSNMSGKIIRI